MSAVSNRKFPYFKLYINNLGNTVGGISNIRATDGGNIASFRSKDSKIGQYIDINSEHVVINYMENGEWKTGFVLASKSDLFGELCTNPNTLTALVAMVNGYDSNVTNIPDAAKKKFSIILNVWASPLSYLGDLTKTHMQVLIIGSGGGVVTRKYESNAWSNWQ